MSCDRVRFAGLRRLRLLVEAAACRARARARSVWPTHPTLCEHARTICLCRPLERIQVIARGTRVPVGSCETALLRSCPHECSVVETGLLVRSRAVRGPFPPVPLVRLVSNHPNTTYPTVYQL